MSMELILFYFFVSVSALKENMHSQGIAEAWIGR